MASKEILTEDAFNIYTQNVFDVLTKVADAINTLTTKIIDLEEKVQSLSQTGLNSTRRRVNSDLDECLLIAKSRRNLPADTLLPVTKQVIDTLVEFNDHIACLELECKVKDEMIRNLLMKIIKK